MAAVVPGKYAEAGAKSELLPKNLHKALDHHARYIALNAEVGDDDLAQAPLQKSSAAPKQALKSVRRSVRVTLQV